MALEKASSSVAKLLLTSNLLRNKQSCNLFSETSSVQLPELEEFSELTSNLFVSVEGKNSSQLSLAEEFLSNYLRSTDLLASSKTTYAQVSELVNKVSSTPQWDTFKPVLTLTKVTEVEKTLGVPAPKEVRKESEKSKNNTARKESEAQQDAFMAEDDDDDEEEEAPSPVKPPATKPQPKETELV